MAKITAADVNKLRKQTGVGMMDCKKALVEADGNFEAAIDILRKKGQKVAAKRGDRDAVEGVALATVTPDGKRGAIICLNCETDFVAKNDEFVKFGEEILNIAIEKNPSNLEEFLGLPYDDRSNVKEKITDQIGKVGEKIDLSDYRSISAEKVIAYIHPGNRVSSLVGINKDSEESSAAGKSVAMQVAAMAPIALNDKEISQEVIDREIEVGKDQAIQEGKPADMAEKIAKGRLNKFFKENTLLQQQFIMDNKKSVQQYLKEVDSDLTVTEFKRISLS